MNKKEVLDTIEKILSDKEAILLNNLASLQSELINDSKSTAGDKHETARAMVQLEQEKLGKQLTDLKQQIAFFKSLKENSVKNTIQAGSLVKTSQGTFYIGTSLGAISANNNSIFCISPIAPLAQQLIGKKTGDEYQLNGRNFVILELH